MLLIDFLRFSASGEPIRVINVETHEAFNYYNLETIGDEAEYMVLHFYSIFNKSRNETCIVVEVVHA